MLHLRIAHANELCHSILASNLLPSSEGGIGPDQVSGVQLSSLLGATSAAQFISATVFMMMKGHGAVGAMLSGAVLLTTGAGLLTLLDKSTAQTALTAVQILVGLGMGFATQMPLIEAQRQFQVAGSEDFEKGPISSESREHLAKEARLLPASNGLILLSTIMGLLIGTSIGQTIIATSLKQNLASIPGLEDPNVVFEAGAASIAEVVPMPLHLGSCEDCLQLRTTLLE